ncbi:hypothetical protein SBOR_3658 [Sclerotinia borealis F-4128]|uniref:Uncharacterized protein n=1 Tax=Sclerotinia borealis (strain F-4128) TaxID=1432307 RepID=W9CJC9_SCLBF|nr:hypothetical protein SBOR_3658 [Sclerotinia borealis F-4128]
MTVPAESKSKSKSSSSSTSTSTSTSTSAQQLRQKLLLQIWEYNNDINTPPDLRIHITGLSVAEGALFERDFRATGLDTDDVLFEAPGTRSGELELELELESEVSKLTVPTEELAVWREETEKAKFKLAAKEQIDARWQERTLKDWRTNKVKNTFVPYASIGSGSGEVSRGDAYDGRIKRNNIGRDEDTLQEIVIDRDDKNSGSERQIKEHASAKGEKKKSPPKGIEQLAESRRKANREWMARESHRKTVEESDEMTRINLLKGVNRAITIAEEVAWKGAEHLRDLMNGDGGWKDRTIEMGDEGTRKDEGVGGEDSLACSRPGHAPALPVGFEPESKRRGGKGLGNGNGIGSSESEGGERRREAEKPPFIYSPGINIPIPPISPLAPKVSKPQPKPVYSPGINIPIPPISPLAPKVSKPQPQPEYVPIIFPVPAIRESRLLPPESPAQLKLRLQRETAHAKFETDKLKYQGDVEGVTKTKDEVGSGKSISKQDGNGKGKGITWADGPTDEATDEPTDNKGEDEMR